MTADSNPIAQAIEDIHQGKHRLTDTRDLKDVAEWIMNRGMCDGIVSQLNTRYPHPLMTLGMAGLTLRVNPAVPDGYMIGIDRAGEIVAIAGPAPESQEEPTP